MKTPLLFKKIKCFFVGHAWQYNHENCSNCNKKAVGLPKYENPPSCPEPKSKSIYIESKAFKRNSLGPKSSNINLETGASDFARKEIVDVYVREEIKRIKTTNLITIALSVLSLFLSLLALILF